MVSARLLVLLLILVGLLALPTAAIAAPSATTLTLALAPGHGVTGRVGTPVSLTATLTDSSTGAPLAGASVALQRGPAFTTSTTGTTDALGAVTFTIPRPAGQATWQAFYDGDGVTYTDATSGQVVTTGTSYPSTLRLTGPSRVVDERASRLVLSWTAADGMPVAGRLVLYRRLAGGPWVAHRGLSTGPGGTTSIVVSPRSDSQWRAAGAAGPGWLPDASNTLTIDNLPPGTPASYPATAPRPAYTPPQARATAAGAAPLITTVPAGVWRSMVGRSWRRGCAVGRSGLRLLRVNYWGFDGYRYRGEMVLNKAVVGRAARALADMYAQQLPIRRMYRVDRFGWSKRLRGANDYKSMRADNSSGFNCRSVVNRPGVRSPHTSGRAVDLNTWENPYRSATGLVPNSWWASRGNPRYAWRSSSHAVVRIWRSHGFRWTYGNLDSQHVDGRTAPLEGTFVG